MFRALWTKFINGLWRFAKHVNTEADLEIQRGKDIATALESLRLSDEQIFSFLSEKNTTNKKRFVGAIRKVLEVAYAESDKLKTALEKQQASAREQIAQLEQKMAAQRSDFEKKLKSQEATAGAKKVNSTASVSQNGGAAAQNSETQIRDLMATVEALRKKNANLISIISEIKTGGEAASALSYEEVVTNSAAAGNGNGKVAALPQERV